MKTAISPSEASYIRAGLAYLSALHRHWKAEGPSWYAHPCVALGHHGFDGGDYDEMAFERIERLLQKLPRPGDRWRYMDLDLWDVATCLFATKLVLHRAELLFPLTEGEWLELFKLQDKLEQRCEALRRAFVREHGQCVQECRNRQWHRLQRWIRCHFTYQPAVAGQQSFQSAAEYRRCLHERTLERWLKETKQCLDDLSVPATEPEARSLAGRILVAYACTRHLSERPCGYAHTRRSRVKAEAQAFIHLCCIEHATQLGLQIPYWAKSLANDYAHAVA